jgi:hypothetical protein
MSAPAKNRKHTCRDGVLVESIRIKLADNANGTPFNVKTCLEKYQSHLALGIALHCAKVG